VTNLATDERQREKDENDRLDAEEAFGRSLDTVARFLCDDEMLKGFETTSTANVGTKLALVHSEVSEALEAARHDFPASTKIMLFGNFEEELADAICRLVNIGEAMRRAGFIKRSLGSAFAAKMKYNRGRPHKHGGKAF
jgi:hypothetical protein